MNMTSAIIKTRCKPLLVLLAIWIVNSIILSGCAKKVPKLDRQKRDVPFVFVRSYSGYPGPKEKIINGIVAAVWQDGTIVRVTSEADVGKSYVKGRLSAEQLETLRNTIKESGVIGSEDRGVVVDAGMIELVIRLEDSVGRWAYSPPHQQNKKIDSIKNQLLSLPLSDEEPADAATYKAYPHDWYK